MGTTVTPILGPVLDGRLAGNEVIRDTDKGAIDGDPTHDRAVGPMQFIPATWAGYASDGNGDGIKDPNNVFDAALLGSEVPLQPADSTCAMSPRRPKLFCDTTTRPLTQQT